MGLNGIGKVGLSILKRIKFDKIWKWTSTYKLVKINKGKINNIYARRNFQCEIHLYPIYIGKIEYPISWGAQPNVTFHPDDNNSCRQTYSNLHLATLCNPHVLHLVQHTQSSVLVCLFVVTLETIETMNIKICLNQFFLHFLLRYLHSCFPLPLFLIWLFLENIRYVSLHFWSP